MSTGTISVPVLNPRLGCATLFHILGALAILALGKFLGVGVLLTSFLRILALVGLVLALSLTLVALSLRILLLVLVFIEFVCHELAPDTDEIETLCNFCVNVEGLGAKTSIGVA